jgi:GR25 family glycosyltransferase involved in LPS biosynthesis
MKVFVIHYKKLYERKIHILEQFIKHNITDYEFVQIDREELLPEHINLYESGYPTHQIAITVSHMYAYRQIAEKYENALIFEDDAILAGNFSEILSKYLLQLPNDYDMLFIGNGADLHIRQQDLIQGKNIYLKGLYPTEWGGDGIGRCTDSYIMSKKCAINICKYIENLRYKINLPIDWWINIAARDNKYIVYWAEPTIVSQGTQTGLFPTSH